jgi:hypothetical protein
MGTGGPFLGGKARPGRDADHSPPSSAEVKNEWELYLLSPQAPPWRVAGSLYLYKFYMGHICMLKITNMAKWETEIISDNLKVVEIFIGEKKHSCGLLKSIINN